MNRTKLTWENGKSTYVSPSGWGVRQSDPLAGDTIRLRGEWCGANAGTLTPIDDAVACDFCNDETHITERGFIAADYRLDPIGGGEVVHTCHACISDAPIQSKGGEEYNIDDVYVRRDTFDSPRSVPSSAEPKPHPRDR